MSEYVCIFDDHRTNAARMPEMDIGSGISAEAAEGIVKGIPADSSALDSNSNLSHPQALALHDFLQRWHSICHPKLMLWICVDTNVFLKGFSIMGRISVAEGLMFGISGLYLLRWTG